MKKAGKRIRLKKSKEATTIMANNGPQKKRSFGSTLLLIIGCLLPFAVLFVLAGLGVQVSPWLFLLVLILCPLILYHLFGLDEDAATANASDHESDEEPEKRSSESKTSASVNAMQELFTWDIFFVKRISTIGDAVVFEGNLRTRAESALDVLRGRFKERFGDKYELLLQQNSEEKPVVVAVPSEAAAGRSRPGSPWINLILFLATIVTTTIAGAAHHGVNLLAEPMRFTVGLPYAAGIMAILGVHELAHYIYAKIHGIDTTLPYFIPIPFGIGTFGAIIQMRSIARSRKALFDTGIAGPLAGLMVTIPLLFIGLKYSTVVQDGSEAGVSLSSSILLAFISKLSLGDAVNISHTVILHPLAFAGWLGLMVTALNLLPIGTLDGGHVGHAMFGRKRAEIIANVAFFALIILGIFVWSGWLMWALLVFFVSGMKSMPPIDDVTELDRKRLVIGSVGFVLLFLIMSPLPHAFYKTIGLHCPYI